MGFLYAINSIKRFKRNTDEGIRKKSLEIPENILRR